MLHISNANYNYYNNLLLSVNLSFFEIIYDNRKKLQKCFACHCNLYYGAQWVKTPHFASDVYQAQSAYNEEMKILVFFFGALSRHCIEIDFFTPIYISYCFTSDISFKEPAFRHICLGFWHQNIPLKAFSKQSISNALEKCFCWKKN